MGIGRHRCRALGCRQAQADDLLRGGRLQSAIDWRAASAPDLTSVEAEYPRRLTRAQRSDLARQRRQNRRLRWALSGAAVLLVASSSPVRPRSRRGDRPPLAAEASESKLSAATSLTLRASDRDVAALLAAEMQRRWPDDSRPGRRSSEVSSGWRARLTARVRRRCARDGNPHSRHAHDPAGHRPSVRHPRCETLPPAGVADHRHRHMDGGRGVRRRPSRRWDGQFRHDVVVSGDGSIALIQTPPRSRTNRPPLLSQLADIHRSHHRRTARRISAARDRHRRRPVALTVVTDCSTFTRLGDLIAIDTHTGAVHATFLARPTTTPRAA